MTQELLKILIEPGIVFIYRSPTKEEVEGLNEIELADAIIIDVKNLGYRDKKGRQKPLGAHVGLKQIRHLRAFGKRPKSWKILIPPKTKKLFIEEISHVRH